MKKNIYLLLAATAVLSSGCATYYLNKGNKEFENWSYTKAIRDYNRCLSRKEVAQARVNLAHAYRLTNDVKDAEQEYIRVLAQPNCEPINLFYYAKVQMQEGKYGEAKTSLKSYLEKVPDDIVAKMLLASCNSVSDRKIDTTLYTLERANIGNVASIFGCVSYKDGAVCTAEKETRLNSKKNPWTGKSYLDLYFSQKDKDGKWISPQILKGEINGQYHEGPASFNNEGNVVYFTRSNYYKYELRKSKKGENNLKLFRAELVNGKWTNLQELPFNSDEYSVGHPCLAPDQKTLYFVSDMPGGYGGTDIYLSVDIGGGKWTPPMNLGPAINTPGNEMFPFAAEDGSFYFSSDAHNSMGGLDVFVSSYQDGKWLQAENLNYPLNTTRDDFAYVLNGDSTGFVSSNRSDTDRVYEFTKHAPKFDLQGLVLDNKTKKPIANAMVKVLGKGKIILSTDADGKYSTGLVPNTNYLVLASMKDYFSRSEDVTTVGEKYSKTFYVNFSLNEMIIEKPIVLENIYYDFDKWAIRADAAKELDKLVKILNDNPTIHIEMGSHTDCRAGDQYNLILSDKRAKAAVDYLVSRGINANRLTWKGYGESRPVNKCVNGVPCTEEEHQLNRRTEFKVVKVVVTTAEK